MQAPYKTAGKSETPQHGHEDASSTDARNTRLSFNEKSCICDFIRPPKCYFVKIIGENAEDYKKRYSESELRRWLKKNSMRRMSGTQESEAREVAAVKDILNEKWETKVNNLAEKTGYDFDFLWKIWMEMLEENDSIHKTEEEKWNYFKDVSYEHDW